MMYTLEKYDGMKSRFDCPNCKGKKSFTRYIDIESKEYLGDHVGRCNKVDNCNYHFKPKQFFEDNKGFTVKYQPIIMPVKTKQMFTISVELLDASLKCYDKNNFALSLANLFGTEKAIELLTLYEIGTSKKWEGANIFWQIDTQGIIRTGKIMLYDSISMKRVKQPYDHIYWVHNTLINKDAQEVKQCFFGEHLITKYKNKPIAIAEAEKTAIICAHFMPQFNWLAAGNINGLSIEKFKVLKGRKVYLFPDLNKGTEIWTNKANEYQTIADITLINYLDLIATDEQKANGLDLADYLINSEGSLTNVA